MFCAKVELENVPCPNRCPPFDELLFSARDRLHSLPGEFNVVRCTRCSLIRTNPRPTQRSIGYYYPDEYGPYLGTRITDDGKRTRSVAFWKRILRPIYRTVFRFNTNVLPDLPPGRILEVGCASGAFLAQMASKGWQVEGIESSSNAANRARAAGFKVRNCAVEQAPDPSEPFDLVVGWMVLEHLHYPLTALTKLSRWTRPEGWLVVSVPNAAAMEFRIFKGLGYALQVPTHLYHYTPATLANLLEKGGWRVERVFHQRILSNLFGSVGNSLEDINAPRSLTHLFKRYPDHSGHWNYVLYPLAWLLALFGQTGRMTVWARKMEDVR